MAFAESTHWREHFFGSRAWRVMFVITFVGLMLINCASGWSRAGFSRFNLNDAAYRSGGALLSSDHSSLAAFHVVSGGALGIGGAARTPPCFYCSAEPPADDTDQADDNPSGGDDLALAGVELSPRVPEWRLNSPDALRVNSFINSKTKPPP